MPSLRRPTAATIRDHTAAPATIGARKAIARRRRSTVRTHRGADDATIGASSISTYVMSCERTKSAAISTTPAASIQRRLWSWTPLT
jgi:hypothetical protein